MIHPNYTIADVVRFSAMVNSTMDGAPVRVTITVETSDEMECHVDRQSVGRLPAAMVETLRILGVIYDGSEPEVDVHRNF